MNKQNWLAFAEVIDALRIVPRAVLFGSFAFYIWYIDMVTSWYFVYLEFLVNKDALTVPVIAGSTAFITSTITALGAMLTWFAGNIYMKTGRAWGDVQKEDLDSLQKIIHKYHGTE